MNYCKNNLTQKGLVELLPKGKQNAISSQELVRLVGCKSVRELQQYIASERAAGAIICSASTGGYFLPANHEEIAEFCKTLESRAANTFATLKSAREAIALPEGQEAFAQKEGDS